jgi:zinc protease
MIEVEKAVHEEIENIATTPLSDEELQKAKNQIEASFVFARDSSYSEALYTGMFEVVAGNWRLKDRYVDGIRNVTPAEVSDVARRYLTKENRTTGFLIPKKTGGVNE